jgi:queuine tRNA-ribosyltransferase/7-cyano-7-deazaguanine tRNA-ribosyltransferase
MIDFTILKKSRRSQARLGLLETPHGTVETPSLVGVATNATIKALRSDEVLATGTQMLISNTYHLHIAAAGGSSRSGGGEKIIKSAGGLNKFMNWPRPTMTDSGGFQVFSLGFGRDLGVGKVAARLAAGAKHLESKLEKAIDKGHQPSTVKINDDGVRFRSPLTGEELFLGPRESVGIQEKIGADIIFAFDECTPPRVTREYMRAALDRTHRWARECIAARRTDQALYGIVQGSIYKDLRQESARFISKLGGKGRGGRDGGFTGFGIGGDLGDALGTSKITTRQVLEWVLPLLDEKKPRHLLGIGKIEDIETIIRAGVDTFDCTVPTHYARRGIAFTSTGPVDCNKAKLLKENAPLDAKCDCLVCVVYRRNYIAHLMRAHEITGAALLTFHNLYFFNAYIARLREKIKKGLI